MVKIVKDIESLRKPTAQATEDDNLKLVSEDMFSTLKEKNGAGLSANQVGYDTRFPVAYPATDTSLVVALQLNMEV